MDLLKSIFRDFWQVFVWICWKVIAKTHKLLHLAPLPNMLLLKLEIVWISQNFPNLNILHPNAANTQKEFVTKSQTCSSSKFPKVSHILKVWAQFDVIIRPKSRFGIIQSSQVPIKLFKHVENKSPSRCYIAGWKNMVPPQQMIKDAMIQEIRKKLNSYNSFGFFKMLQIGTDHNKLWD